jgi:hypothetical protein
MVQSSGKTNIDQTDHRAPVDEKKSVVSYFFHVYIGRAAADLQELQRQASGRMIFT